MAIKKSRALKDLSMKSLLTYMNPRAAIASQMRAIRNNMDSVIAADHHRIIAITSPGAKEGKTVATVNLAISRTQRGDKVLLLDANMRNPMIHDIFNMKVSPGLTNILAGQSTLKEAAVSSGIGRLAILPFGTFTYNSIEMLNSAAMDDLLATARETYDWIFLDTAPVLEVLDTPSLVNKCDGVIMVVCKGVTTSEKALKAKRSIEFAGKTNLIGVIHNQRG